MSTDPGYRVRLKARIGKGLSTDDNTRTANFHGRPLTVRAADEDQPLNEAKWLVFSAGGFATADEAHDYGERLRRAVRLAGISTIVGVDARTAGDDRTTSHLSPAGENWMRSLGLPRPEHRTASDVHGLSVRSDDDNLRDRLHRPLVSGKWHFHMHGFCSIASRLGPIGDQP